jgi:hypothetical protein
MCLPFDESSWRPGAVLTRSTTTAALSEASSGALGEPRAGLGVDGAKVESEGKLRFYTPEQVDRLIAEASDEEDEAIHTVAAEGGGEDERNPCLERSPTLTSESLMAVLRR